MKNYILILLVSGFCGISILTSCNSPENKNNATETVSESEPAYICPMNCVDSGSDEPGKCKVCGMDLEKNPDKK